MSSKDDIIESIFLRQCVEAIGNGWPHAVGTPKRKCQSISSRAPRSNLGIDVNVCGKEALLDHLTRSELVI